MGRVEEGGQKRKEEEREEEIVIGREGAERGGKLMGKRRERQGGEGERGSETTLSDALPLTRLHL